MTSGVVPGVASAGVQLRSLTPPPHPIRRGLSGRIGCRGSDGRRGCVPPPPPPPPPTPPPIQMAKLMGEEEEGGVNGGGVNGELAMQMVEMMGEEEEEDDDWEDLGKDMPGFKRDQF